ncbi:MAG: nondiscriminating aspartyl-tRNA synthetase [Parcubacteria group bacterium Gr01-1014_30]|nr:MAG: nondiscriminating aspartyl-tRNA synthetase [Parcubacteria group bacterium Gr01-1014_30]
MQRVLNSETQQLIDQKVKVAGWVNSRRDHGKLVFLDLRDRSGILQVVCSSELAKDVKDEFVLEVEGVVQERPKAMINPALKTGEIELKAEKVSVLAKADSLPFDLKELNLSLPTLLDWRPLTLRNPKVKAIFKVQEQVVESFRRALKEMDFTEFQPPTIVASATEGGAELFPIQYYKYKAYLAQSPQLYKQILVGVFERVFAVTKAYRAEPSVTTRHISEYISLDAEMGFINAWEELMDTCAIVVKKIFYDLQKSCQEELKMFNVDLREVGENIPRLKISQAQRIIFERTGRDNTNVPDLTPEDEREICQFAKEKHESELIFITHFPTKKRPFYTQPDPDGSDYTLSFDLLFRGVEIVTGGQRIHEYEKLLKNIKKFGFSQGAFKFYLQAFQYGMPPEGGFCMGAERMTKQILGLENVKEAGLFPRDMERIDQRLSASLQKETKKPRAKRRVLKRRKKKK